MLVAVARRVADLVPYGEFVPILFHFRIDHGEQHLGDFTRPIAFLQGKRPLELEFDGFPSIRRLVARLPANCVDDLPLVPVDDLDGPFDDLRGHLRCATKQAQGDQRQIRRLGGIHLICRPIFVLDVERAQDDDNLRRFELLPILLFQPFFAASSGWMIGYAAILIEKIRRAFHVFEYTVIIRVASKRVGHEDADRVLGGHLEDCL